jgi:hypothetical protein
MELAFAPAGELYIGTAGSSIETGHPRGPVDALAIRTSDLGQTSEVSTVEEAEDIPYTTDSGEDRVGTSSLALSSVVVDSEDPSGSTGVTATGLAGQGMIPTDLVSPRRTTVGRRGRSPWTHSTSSTARFTLVAKRPCWLRYQYHASQAILEAGQAQLLSVEATNSGFHSGLATRSAVDRGEDTSMLRRFDRDFPDVVELLQRRFHDKRRPLSLASGESLALVDAGNPCPDLAQEFMPLRFRSSH